ncbi:serine hydrolase domain-containing protein [Arenibaculum pallidiluteum]|uniref:serine hydrolase domain-containing protein n=1 Tax=Arenibaculum pallidiluteum TaxID=2812559 RepID=UPI001A973E79|nr:serine hydrolase domain-containing protein [Arenibaculum pallidiluteum]
MQDSITRQLSARIGGATLLGLLAASAPGIAWAGSLPVTDPARVGMSAERLGKIEQVFRSEVDAGRLAGVVMLVARNGMLAYSSTIGFQDKQAGKPMTEDAIFRIYSMTKPLASVGAMLLMEDGRLQLTDPVSRYLPEFASTPVSVGRTDPYGKITYTTVAAERQATVQDLLRHTAGLTYGETTENTAVKEGYAKAGVYQADGTEYELRDVTPEDQVRALAQAPLVHQPGTRWEYSLATDVLGRVVEKVSGMRLGEFLRQRLFEPLRMNDTGFSVPQQALARLAEPLPTGPAAGSATGSASGARNAMLDVSTPPRNDSGGAGGVSTAGDYLRFLQMLANGGELDGVRVLSPTTVRLMTSDHLGTRITPVVSPGELLLGTPGYTFGLGFAVREGDGIAGVPGSKGEFLWAGYGGTYFWVDPQERIAAVMMSQSMGPGRTYHRKLFKQMVYQAITDGPQAGQVAGR